MARTSILEAVKIQARALIPVVKALESELGNAELQHPAAHGVRTSRKRQSRPVDCV